VSRTEVAVVALIVLLMAWLLMPPPVVYPDPPPAIDPCPQMWDATRGLYGGCMVFLPIVVHCAECMSAWPVWPGKGE
jgi:hypothetical protein